MQKNVNNNPTFEALKVGLLLSPIASQKLPRTIYLIPPPPEI
jgi:hypothetical protein